MYEPTKEIKDLCALEDNFCWHGDTDIPDKERWGPTISKSRDSGPLEESNFQAITQDMLERFPEDTRIVLSTHWGFGWVEQLFVRHYDDNGPTPAHEAIMQWHDKLSNYPVANEEDFSQREYDSQLELLTSCYPVDEEQAKKVWQWLWDNEYYFDMDSSGPYMDSAPINEAIKALGFEESD